MTTAKSVPRRGGLVRNVIHLGLGQVATTVLTILLSATLARTLGASEFGLLYLLTSVATFAYVVVDWGHGPYIIREAAKHLSDLASCWVAMPSALMALVRGCRRFHLAISLRSPYAIAAGA